MEKRIINNSISICYWNIHGMYVKLDGTKSTCKLDLKDVQEIVENKDIVCLSETKINNSQIHDMKIKGYTVKAITRKRKSNATHDSGGITIYVKDTIKLGITFIPNKSSEYAWVKLHKETFNLKDDIFLCFLYINPEYSTYSSEIDVIDEISREIALYKNKGKCLLMGDFNGYTNTMSDDCSTDSNCKIFDTFPLSIVDNNNSHPSVGRRSKDLRQLNNRGREIIELCKMCGLCILNGRKLGDITGNFTCYAQNAILPSVIDYAIAQCELYGDITFFRVLPLNVLSDHCPIELTLHAVYCQTDNTDNQVDAIELQPLQSQYKWHGRLSSEHFERALGCEQIKDRLTDLANLNSELNEERINAAVGELNDIILQTAEIASIPKKIQRKQSKPQSKRKKVHTNPETIALGKRVKRLCREVNANPHDRCKRQCYYKYRKVYKRKLKQEVKERREKLIEKIQRMENENPKEYWKVLEELKDIHSEKEQTSEMISPTQWYNHFYDLTNTEKHLDNAHRDIVASLQTNKGKKTFSSLDFSITPVEVLQAIQRLKTGKSPGCDGILNEMLKAGKYRLSPVLAKVFNMVLISGIFPDCWSLSFIVPLFKGGSKLDPGNYRGISLSSSMGKLFCSVLNKRLVKYLDENEIYVRNQSGFREGHRTVDHLYVLRTVIDKYVKNHNTVTNGKLYLSFVDLKKAFDNVWREGLFYKLLTMGIGGSFYNIVSNMYEKSKSCIKLKNGVSPQFITNIGVKQGCTLSPTLFNSFLNDLPGHLGFDGTDPVDILGQRVNCLMYADDIVLLSTSKQGMQNSLDKLQEYCKTWLLKINLDKTNILICNKSGRFLKNNTFYINGRQLQTVRSATYLGLKINSSGTFEIGNIVEKSKRAIFKLYRCFGDNRPNVKIAKHLFNSLIKPILLYGAEVWGVSLVNFGKVFKLETGNSKRYFKNDIESVHLKWLKYILGVNKRSSSIAVLAEVGEYPLIVDVCRQLAKYWLRMKEIDRNSLLYLCYQMNEQMIQNESVCWLENVHTLLKLCKIRTEENDIDVCLNPENISLNTKVFGEEVVSQLRSTFDNQFTIDISNDNINGDGGNKLRTYRRFKKGIQEENYLTIVKSFKLRKNICRLRISSHNLAIETGRHRRPIKIAPHLRFCTDCHAGQVGDEEHIIMNCQKFNTERQQLFNHLRGNSTTFNSLSEGEKFVYVMTMNNVNTVEPIILYINSVILKRGNF